MAASAALRTISEKKVSNDRIFSLEKYFQREEKALHKSEYHNGKIIKMPGGTFNHNVLGTKASALLNNFIEDNDLNYFVNGSDIKIRIDVLEYDFNKLIVLKL